MANTRGKNTQKYKDSQTYNSNYPWLTESSFRKMESAVDQMGLSGENKTQAMNNYYQSNAKYLLNDQLLDERDNFINDQAYQAAQLQDGSANAQLRMTQASQKAKRQWNLRADANDLDVFTSIVESLGAEWMDLAGKYLSWESNDLLFAAWLRDKMEAPETKESSVWGIQSVINKQSEVESDSILWKIWNGMDRVNIPWKITQEIDSLVQKIPTLTYDKQVENLANKINNLSEDELWTLYDKYVKMVKNWLDPKKWENDDRNGYELVWDAVTWDKDALDRVNTLRLYDYSEAMPQDNIEKNQWGTQLWNKIWGADVDTVNKNIDASNMNDTVKDLAKASVWTADKAKNLLNFIWWSWGWLENYAEWLGVGLQELKDIKNENYYPEISGQLENDKDAFTAYVADKTANFGEYMTDAPDTLLWKPVSPNAVKFISNIPQSFMKLLSSSVRGRTNQADSKLWLLKMLFTEEWQQAAINRYGSLENVANTMNTDPAWLADDMLMWADKLNSVLNKTTWGAVERQEIWSVADAIAWDTVNLINNGLTRTSNWLNDKGYNRTANFVNLERDVSTNPANVMQDAKDIAKQWVEDIKTAWEVVADTAWAVKDKIVESTLETLDSIKNAPTKIKDAIVEWKDKVVEGVAEKMVGAKSWQDKLFVAQEPSLNRLSKERNTKNIRNKADVANELIVKDIQKNGWELPTDTETRLNAHQRAMNNIWAEIEMWLKDKDWYMISTAPLADALDKYIAKERSYWITSNEWDLKALEEQSQALRNRWSIDVATAEWLKQRVNAKINDWDDKSVWNTAKNGLRILTQEIWSVEDAVIAKIPGEFQDLKNDFGALADAYEDVLKADIKQQRAKEKSGLNTFSRVEWLAKIGKWIISWKWGDLVEWAVKTVLWEAWNKVTDKDWLIEQWFKDLATEMENPEFKSSKKNKAWQPKYK